MKACLLRLRQCTSALLPFINLTVCGTLAQELECLTKILLFPPPTLVQFRGGACSGKFRDHILAQISSEQSTQAMPDTERKLVLVEVLLVR